MKTVTIVGAGRLGSALAIALGRQGYTIDELVYRTSAPTDDILELLPGGSTYSSVDGDLRIKSEITLITTQDTEIEAAAAKLCGKVFSSVILHTSGSLASSVLDQLRTDTTAVGSMHPLVSVSEPVSGSARFTGAYFCIEGDDRAVETAKSLAADIGALTFSIPTKAKSLYHAAAVMSSGHIVALTETAANVLEECGIGARDARSILMPLIESTIDNLKRQSAARSMTGTYARLDEPAFYRHVSALEGSADDLTLSIYLDLAIRSLQIVKSTSSEPAAVDKMLDEVNIAKRNRRVIK